MMDYIAEIEGDYYEGTQVKLRLMTPPPIILKLRIQNEASNPPERIFVEDYFNSSTRIRRGRVYRIASGINWSYDRVTPRPLSVPGQIPGMPPSQFVPCNKVYVAEDNMSVPYNATIILGQEGIKSSWIAVMVERVVSLGLVVTLKAKTFLGVLPDVNRDALPEGNRQDILLSLNAVVDAASIQAPQAVVDACRNAASHMISAKFPASNPDGKKDLGDIVKWLIAQGKLEKCTDAADSLLYLMEASASHLVNRLHSRGKANGPAQNGTRPLSSEDANLAVSAVAFLLQDFGWAESREL